MFTSVKLVHSLLEEEAADGVHFPKLALHVPYHHNFVDLPSDYQNAGAELMDFKEPKKSFASFRIRPKGKFISNYFELSLSLGTQDRMVIKAAESLMHKIKQLIRSQALDNGGDEDSNDDKKVKRRRNIY